MFRFFYAQRVRQSLALLAALIICAPPLRSNSTPQTLPYNFVTADDSLITLNDNWDNVPGIIGFRGDTLASTGANAQTVLGADDTAPVVDVNIGQTTTFTTGGVAEFSGTSVGSLVGARTIYALQGSGTADAPYLRFHFNTLGSSNLSFSYTAVDLDLNDNAVQQVAVHYRTAATGAWTNLADGYIADATQGPAMDGLRTTRTFSLPAAAANQAILQIRILSVDAAGSDEWVGIENVSLSAGVVGPTPPSGVGSASPSSVLLGQSSLLSVNVTPGANPVASVTADLSTIGGSSTQAFANQGGNLWTFNATATGTIGSKVLPVTIADNAALTGSTSIALLVTNPLPPSGTGTASPASVPLGQNTLLSVNVTPGTNPVASVTGDLSSIGGSSTQAFSNQGGNLWTFNATTAGTTGNKLLPVTIADNAALSGTLNIALSVTGPPVSISSIQGNGNTSPLAGQLVTTSGIVTMTNRLGRIFIQSPDASADNDPNTSEGLLLQFTSTPPAAANVLGALLTVTGTVDEYRADNNNLTITRILNPSVAQVSTGNPLPQPVVLSSTSFLPNGGLFQAERFEGMRVTVPSLTVTGPTGGETVIRGGSNGTSNQSLNGILYGVFPGTARPFREPGIQASTSPIPACDFSPCTPATFDGNPELVRIDTFRQNTATAGIGATFGATLTGVTGVLNYENRFYTIVADPTPAIGVTGNISATPAPTPTAGEIIVGSWNFENYTGTATKQAKASLAIRNFLNFPDVLATIEMNQPAALVALAAQVNADAVAAGQPNPNYQTRIVTPPNPGQQNIGFLVKSDVTIVSATQALADRRFTDPTDGSSDITFDRPPLILEAIATRGGKQIPFTVIGNHLLSLIDIDSDPDPTSPRRRAKRKDQAEAMAELLQARLTATPAENIFMVGDFNAFQFNDGYVDVINGIRGVPAAPGLSVVTVADNLNATTLNNTLDTLPASNRYSFVFQGSAQALDHILYTPGLQNRLSRAANVRLGSDFPTQFSDDATRVERMTDHDAVLFYLLAAEPLSSGISFSRFGGFFNPATQRTITNLQITNSSSTALSAPWQIVIPDPAANVTLANSTGANLQGKYITVNTPLAAGASLTIQLQFTNPGRMSFVYNPKFYSGVF